MTFARQYSLRDTQTAVDGFKTETETCSICPTRDELSWPRYSGRPLHLTTWLGVPEQAASACPAIIDGSTTTQKISHLVDPSTPTTSVHRLFQPLIYSHLSYFAFHFVTIDYHGFCKGIRPSLPREPSSRYVCCSLSTRHSTTRRFPLIVRPHHDDDDYQSHPL